MSLIRSLRVFGHNSIIVLFKDIMLLFWCLQVWWGNYDVSNLELWPSGCWWGCRCTLVGGIPEIPGKPVHHVVMRGGHLKTSSLPCLKLHVFKTVNVKGPFQKLVDLQLLLLWINVSLTEICKLVDGGFN